MQYSYDLLPSLDHIRIITLLPGGTLDKIECTMKTILQAETEGTYEAISYVWGDIEDTATISCDGREIQVTASLSNALRAIRTQDVPKQLWADAICINQADDTEKGHQIKKMGLVYAGAKRVVVWLGFDDEQIAEGCFQRIRQGNAYFAAQFGTQDNPQLSLSNPEHRIFRNPACWAGFRELVKNPWFKRVWVIHEAGLARLCTLMWGRQQIDIAEVLELITWIFDLEITTFVHDLDSGFILDIYEEVQCKYTNTVTWRDHKPHIQKRCFLRQGSELVFGLVLASTRNLQATDPRDRVYAFLGLPQALRPDGKLIIEPDYKKPVEEVYFDVARALIQNPREAPWVICSVQHTTQAAIEGCKLPSWCPRWDEVPWETSPACRCYWYCAGGVKHELKAQVDQARYLCVAGSAFDHISWCSLPLNDEDFEIDSASHDSGLNLIPFVDGLYKEVLQQIGQEREGLETEFSLTLVREYPADPDGRLSLNVKGHQESFEAYLEAVRPSRRTKIEENDLPDAGISSVWAAQFTRLLSFAVNLLLVVTKHGKLGLVPFFTEPGDECFLFPGVPNPVILRATDDGKYSLVGACYLYGVMRGELMTEIEKGNIKLQSIRIA